MKTILKKRIAVTGVKVDLDVSELIALRTKWDHIMHNISQEKENITPDILCDMLDMSVFMEKITSNVISIKEANEQLFTMNETDNADQLKVEDIEKKLTV
jgi:hypothetical protein